MTKDTGGPAFPQQEFKQIPGGGGHWTNVGGMTLRQYYAGQALMGMAATINAENFLIPNHYGTLIAAACFNLADAMIEQQGK
jgi:hypothetical protein